MDADGARHGVGSDGVVGGRSDVELAVLGQHLASQGVERHEALDLVAEELDTHRHLLIDGEDVDGVALDAERAADRVHVVADVLPLDERAQQLLAGDLVADLEPDHSVQVLLRRAQAVDAGDARDDDDVAPRQQ